MVSGRHKAYEPAESAGDYLSNDTSASAFLVDFIIRKDANIAQKFITVEGRRFSRKNINKLVREARKDEKDAVFLFRYSGELVQPVEMHGQKYIGLLRLKGRGGFRRFVIYDFLEKKIECRIKEARLKLETLPHEQEGMDDIYLDDIASLEAEEY